MTEPAGTPSLDGLMNLPNRPPQAVSKSLFAEIAGVTKGRVSQMIAEGLPVRLDGKIDREEGLAWIEKNISRRSAPEAIAPSSAFAAARADRERANADLARLEYERKAGELISRHEVIQAAFERARMERDAHLGFVARVAGLAASELGCDHAAIAALLDREMRAHLARLADHPLRATP